MEKIQPEAYEAFLLLVVSGQIGQEEVPKLLRENPDFERWYRERRLKRQGSGTTAAKRDASR